MGRKTLLVEGKHDGIVICELCHRHDIKANKFEVGKLLAADEIGCKGAGSIEKLLRQVPVELKASDIETLGIIMDADTNLASRWNSICDRLRNIGYKTLPVTPDGKGTIIQETDRPRLGIWVMPDNRLGGMVEDFVSFLIPESDELWEYAQRCVEEIENDKRPFTSHIAKAKIHTWLAWREKPGTPLGSAINYRYLDAHVPEALIFATWIKELFQV